MTQNATPANIEVNDTVTILDGTRRFDVTRIENMGDGAIDGPLARIWPWDDGAPNWISLALLRKVSNPDAPVTVAPAVPSGYALPPRPEADLSGLTSVQRDVLRELHSLSDGNNYRGWVRASLISRQTAVDELAFLGHVERRLVSEWSGATPYIRPTS